MSKEKPSIPCPHSEYTWTPLGADGYSDRDRTAMIPTETRGVALRNTGYPHIHSHQTEIEVPQNHQEEVNN